MVALWEERKWGWAHLSLVKDGFQLAKPGLQKVEGSRSLAHIDIH